MSHDLLLGRTKMCTKMCTTAAVLSCLAAVALAQVGCAAGKGPALDALVGGGQDGGGLAERFLTETVPSADRPGQRDGAGEDASRTDAPREGAGRDGPGDVASPTCAVADAKSCKVGEACYPLPLSGPPAGGVGCAGEGLGDELSLCVAQNDCDRDHYCDGAGDVGGLCRQRCDPRAPTACARGTQCWAFAGWLTAGVCR